ncbi:MAG: type II toxin-antitoxin system YoeB family toxin [Deltaproteobacteria bacterium]|nr:type II toxin-antitoxin system YoeB family toxin [Deltaproteobacteria bacterium]
MNRDIALLQNFLKPDNLLIHEIQRVTYEGRGKPEPLKHALSDYWSRRVTDDHRLLPTTGFD